MDRQNNPLRIVEYGIVGLMVLLIGAFVGWYFYLQGQKKQVEVVNQGRGLTSETPSFTDTTGSTYADISGSLPEDTATNTGTSVPSDATSQGQKQIVRLWKVDNLPVAGMGFIHDPGSHTLYFTERATGYISSANPFTQSITRISGVLRPKVYNAIFSYDGSVIQQTVDASGSVQTLVGAVVASTSTDPTAPKQSLVGQMLTQDIRAITMNPQTKDILYLTDATGGGVVVSTTTFANAKQSVIYTSPIASWSPQWLPDGRIIWPLDPADAVLGYAYLLQPKDHALIPLIRAVPGLMVNPHPTASAVLYSSSTNGDVSLFVRSDSGTTTIKIPLHTVASKCVWGPDVLSVSTSSVASSTATSTKATKTKVRNTEPIITVRHSHTAYCAAPATQTGENFLMQWFRGETHTSDEWWKIDTSTGSTTLVYSPYKEESLDLDVEKPSIDTDGTYIAFINGRDLSLWMLRINP